VDKINADINIFCGVESIRNKVFSHQTQVNTDFMMGVAHSEIDAGLCDTEAPVFNIMLQKLDQQLENISLVCFYPEQLTHFISIFIFKLI
jgi:hypothetical protein